MYPVSFMFIFVLNSNHEKHNYHKLLLFYSNISASEALRQITYLYYILSNRLLDIGFSKVLRRKNRTLLRPQHSRNEPCIFTSLKPRGNERKNSVRFRLSPEMIATKKLFFSMSGKRDDAASIPSRGCSSPGVRFSKDPVT